MKKFPASIGTPVLLCWLLLACAAARADVWLIDVQGAIGPATADHMIRSLDQAQENGAELAVLLIDTPGGLDTAMRDMVKAVLKASIPVVGYVTPGGARAASAGTYLLYATHVAAMAPGTNLGAATPVQIASPGLPRVPDDNDGSEPAPSGGSAMEKKLVNDAVAYIQSLAQLRGRNTEWAEKAVREGASLSAEDALAEGVIDLLAGSVEELLGDLHGREISLGDGDVSLHTEGLALYHQPVDWRSRFLAVITDPNIAYILMLVGIYGLIIEFYNPGIGLPGVVGAMSLLLAFYAFQVLPISYAGLGLILLGIALMTAEAFAPSFGVLGLGGVAAFAIGSIMLMDTELPGYQIAMPMIAAFTLFSAVLLSVALGLVIRARRREVVTGKAHLLGATGVVEMMRDDAAYVRLDGELWHAESDQTLSAQDEVMVDEVSDLVLKVRKLEKRE